MAVRADIIEGLIRGLDNWLEISMLIAASPDRTAALQSLMESSFDFTEIQAVHVLDTSVSRLTASGRAALTDELARFQAELSALPEA